MWIAVVALVVFGVVLVWAVCWLAHRTEGDEIKTPILTWRRGSSSDGPKVDTEP
jgi:hypothetical protein